MNYNLLLDLAVELGYRLAMCGAETFRVEESINRVLGAYGIESEAFAIPNCLTVSIQTAEGVSMTRMRRIGYHGNDLDGVERFSGLSRRICSEKPDPSVAKEWLKTAESTQRTYQLPIYLLGNFLGSMGFCVFYGGTLSDSLLAGLLALLGGLVNQLLDNLSANPFFKTIISAFLMSFPAYLLGHFHLAQSPDTVIIGCLMLLVPGLVFTNAMRDIIYGDTNSGINRIVQVFLISIAIALGTASALNLTSMLLETPPIAGAVPHSMAAVALACTVGCIGFSILFNIHGPGMLLCALGGMLTWFIYAVAQKLGCSEAAACFWGCLFGSSYAEAMARIRKYPAISYLVVSIFPLLPGSGVYYTMNFLVRGDMDHFVSCGLNTIAVAGAMAVGILMISTGVRLWTTFKIKHLKR